MQVKGDSFDEAVKAAVRYPICKFVVYWDGLISTDESDYLLEVSGEMNLNAPGDDLVQPGEVATASVKLKNVEHRFSWNDSRSELYAYINGAMGLTGLKVRIYIGFYHDLVPTWNPITLMFEYGPGYDYVNIFTGVIYQWDEDPASGTVTLEMRDRGYTWIQDKRSTAVYEDQRPDEWIAVLADLAGILPGNQILDAAIGQIPYCWCDDESLVEEIFSVAQADGGVAYFDQMGYLHFESPAHWLNSAHQAISWEFTADDYQNVDMALNPDDVATSVVVEWSPRYKGPVDTLYTLDGVKYVESGSSISWEARFNNPAWSVITPFNTETSKDYFGRGAGGQDFTGELVVELSNIYAQRCTVTVTALAPLDGDGFTVQLTLLQIRGYPLLGGSTEQIKVDVVPAPDLVRERSIRGNPYLQTYGQGAALAERLAVLARRIRPNYTLLGVPGVPHLELGDRISFENNRQIYPSSVDGPLIGISWRFNETVGFEQSLTILDDTDYFDYTDYFIVGITALGDHGRCWY